MNIQDFTLRQLAYFVATAETGSIFHAAEKLHISKSALSAALNELERILDTQLLIRRKARGVSLTANGHRAYVQACAVLREAEEIPHVTSHTGLAGTLNLGCFPSLSPTVLPPLLDGFARDQPGIKLNYLELDMAGLEHAVRSGTVDVGIAHNWEVPEDFERATLTALKPYLILPADHWASGRSSVSLQDLEEETVILPSVRPGIDHVLSLFRAAEVSPKHRLGATSFELTRALVGRRRGYAISLQRSQNTTSHEGLPLIQMEIADDLHPIEVLMVWQQGISLSSRAQAFIDYSRTIDWSSRTGAGSG